MTATISSNERASAGQSLPRTVAAAALADRVGGSRVEFT